MTSRTPILIVDLFKDVVTDMNLVLQPSLNVSVRYHYGSSIQILKKLVQLNEGITTKQRFPLIALFQPFQEVIGGDGYYAHVKIKKIVIAMLSNLTDDVPDRYNKTFVPVLYPIYYEFLNQIAQNGYFVINDAGMIPHTKIDIPGSPPPKNEADFNEFVDAIEINDLELTINEQINCK